MPRLRQAQTNFSQGEFSPLMAARADLKQYAGGAAKLLNRRPLSQGGTDTRPAFEHVATMSYSPAVLIPFVFRSDQRYVLALSDGRLDAWTSGGTACTPVTGCPWTGAHLDSLTWCVAGDTILIFHTAFQVHRITRTGATTFAVTSVTWEVPGLGRLQASSVTMAVSAVGAPATTAVATFSTGFLTAAYVGRYFRWNGKNALVTGYISPTQCDIYWTNDSTGLSTAATADWLETAWAPEFGYPSCGAVHDGRLYVAATLSQPSSFWASRVGAPFNFDLRTAQDADGIAEAVGGLEAVPAIRHLVAADKMLVLADGGVWWLSGQSDKPVTPSTIGVRTASAVGASAVRPAINDGAVLYIDATGRVAREARWSDSLQKFTDDPVSLVAEHLVQSPAQMTPVLGNSTQPARLVVIANEDGTISVQHSIAAERVNAWAPWETDGTVHSVAGVERDLFLAVERDGAWRLERASETRAPLDAVARVTAGAPTRTFTGFTHLAGLTVAATYNGHDLGDVVVDGLGTLTLSPDAPEVPWVEAGLRYSQVIRPLSIEADIADGASRGTMKRLMRVFVRVIGRGDIKVKGDTKVLGFQGDDYATPPDEFSGEVAVRVHGVSEDCVFDVEVPGAYRVTVLSLTREVQING